MLKAPAQGGKAGGAVAPTYFVAGLKIKFPSAYAEILFRGSPQACGGAEQDKLAT